MGIDDYDTNDIELAGAMLEAMKYDTEKIEGAMRLLYSALEDRDFEGMTIIFGLIGSNFLAHKNILQ